MTTRPAGFRPSRKSLGAPVIEKENFSQQSDIQTGSLASAAPVKRKRAKSLGGNEPVQKRAAPRRSILKSGASLGDEYAETINLGAIRRISRLDDSDSEEEEQDVDSRRKTADRAGAEERRKSMARRVSFAPNAHIRTFTPDKPTAQAQAQAAALDSPSQSSQEPSTISAQSLDSDEGGELSMDASEESMEMAGDDVTVAFAGHFKGSIPASVYAEDEDEDEDLMGAGIEDDEDCTQEMDVAEGDEMTRFFVKETTAIINAQALPSALRSNPAPISTSTGFKPRASVGVRMQSEDDDDEAIMKSLGLGKGNRPRASVAFRGAPTEDEEDDADTDEEDRTMAMDMTVAIGSTIVSSTSAAGRVGFAGVEDDSEEEDEEDISMMEQTMDMEAATGNYGSILKPEVEFHDPGVATPSTASARLQAQLFARQSLNGIAPGTTPIKAPNSPRRSSIPRSNTAASPRVAGRVSQIAQNALLGSPSVSSPARKAPSSSNRSPGGSLSLRGMLLQEQHTRVQPAPPSSLAQPSPIIAQRKTFGSPMRKQAIPAVGGWESPTVGGWESPVAAQSRATKKEQDVDSSLFANNESPCASLPEFLAATEVKFFDEPLVANESDNNKRRKSIAPTNMNEDATPATFGDIAVAGGSQCYYWQLYRMDHAEITAAMENSRGVIDEITAKTSREPPLIFKDWASASKSQQAAIQNQLGIINNKYRAQTVAEWNKFKVTRMAPAIAVMENHLNGLQADVEMVENSKFEDVLSHLAKRKAELLLELHAERARDLELSACDQEILSENRSAVVEQASAVEEHSGKFAELTGSLEVLVEKTKDILLREEQLTAEVDSLRKQSEEGRSFTKSNFLRMNAEFESLQFLHSTTIKSFTSSTISLLHYDELLVTLNLATANGKSSVKSVTLELIESASKEPSWKVELNKFLLDKVLTNINWALKDPTQSRAKMVIQRIVSLWLNVRQLRKEFTLASARYPLSALLTKSTNQNLPNLQIVAQIHSPVAKSTFTILMEITGEELVESGDLRRATEPNKVVEHLGVEVRAVFGSVDCEEIGYIVRDKLETFGRGAIVAACDAAEDKYER